MLKAWLALAIGYAVLKPIRCQGIKRWLTLTMLQATGPSWKVLGVGSEGEFGGGKTLLKQDTNRIILKRTIKPAYVHVCTLHFTFNTLSTSGHIMHQ